MVVVQCALQFVWQARDPHLFSLLLTKSWQGCKERLEARISLRKSLLPVAYNLACRKLKHCFIVFSCSNANQRSYGHTKSLLNDPVILLRFVATAVFENFLALPVLAKFLPEKQARRFEPLYRLCFTHVSDVVDSIKVWTCAFVLFSAQNGHKFSEIDVNENKVHFGRWNFRKLMSSICGYRSFWMFIRR